MGSGTASTTPWGFQLGVVLAFLLASGSQGLNHEGWLLLALKSQMVDTFHHLDDWNPRDPSPCGWKGVNCSSASRPAVVSLNLSNMNLSGTVALSIGGLAELTSLDLSFNGFFGTIPAEIGNCSKLVGLYLNTTISKGTVHSAKTSRTLSRRKTRQAGRAPKKHSPEWQLRTYVPS